MSLILDALNKADRERDNEDSIPDLHTVHGGVTSEVLTAKKWLLTLGVGGLIVLLLSALLALLIFRFFQSPPPIAVATEGASSLAREAFVEQIAVEPTKVSTAPTETQSLPSDEVVALYGAEIVREPIVIKEPTVTAARRQDANIGRRSTVDHQLAQRLWDESQPQVPAEQHRAKDQVELQPEAAESEIDAPFEETLAAYVDLPFLHELPVSVQNTIPTLMYALHQYPHSSVVINKKTYTEGDEIVAGLVIERLLADGLILHLDGQEFKLSALSSWVNY